VAGAAGATTLASVPAAAAPYVFERPDDASRLSVDVVATFPPLLPDAPASPHPAPGYAPAAAAVAAWGDAVASFCASAAAASAANASCALAVAAPDRAVVTAPLPLAPALAAWLARSDAVHWVSPRARRGARNYFAATITQSGTAPSPAVQAGAAPWPGPDPASTPHWAAGLRGQGAVLGMGDTGIDYDHCLLRDAAVPVAVSAATPVGGVPAFASSAHSKIALLRALADSVDASGHGTHCAASAVGAAGGAGAGGVSAWQGGAPGARLAFTDMGSGAGGELGVPLDLVHDYFPYAYER
jgi:hypothetical protein